MNDDIAAQNYLLLDALSPDATEVAFSALRTISETESPGGAFARVLGIQFSEFANGRCTASLEVRHHLLNPHQIAHGGVTYALADFACGGAVLSALGAPRLVTQDMQIRYHGPARAGLITAQAMVIHHGRRTLTAECRVRQNGVLVASATATFAILNENEVDGLR
jgi:acyl-CoA thioesterase